GLYKSILNEIISLVFDEKYLNVPGSRVNVIFLNFNSFPIPSATESHGVWKSRHDELLDELVKALRTIKKLKMGLAFMNHLSMSHNSVISCGAETSAHYNKKALYILLSAAAKMMDIIHQKGEFLAKCFDKHLEIKSLFRGYLTYTDKNKEEIQSESSLSTRFLIHFYISSLHNPFFNNLRKTVCTNLAPRLLKLIQVLIMFMEQISLVSLFDCHLDDQSLAPVFEPSVKYFRHIYLPLLTFVHQIGGFYVDKELFINSINSLSCIGKYSKNDQFCDINQEEISPLVSDRPLLNSRIYTAVFGAFLLIRSIMSSSIFIYSLMAWSIALVKH
ncbi:hypothetical protein MXB_1261, partial [Myxobolus squamalis]